jgi:hypothetical protein
MLERSDLLTYVRTVRSDETYPLLVQAFGIYDSYEADECMGPYDDMLEQSPELSEEDRVLAILQVTRDMMTDLLRQQGVFVSGEGNLSEIVELARATQQIGWYEDHDTLLAICDQYVNPEEVYAECVALVSHLSVQRVLDIIEKTSADMTERIRSIARTAVQAVVPDARTDTLLQKFALWKRTYCEDSPLFCVQWSVNHDTAGLPMQTYLAAYLASHPLPVEPTGQQLEQIAMELFGMASLSGDASANLLESLRAVITQLYHDLKYSMPLANLIDKHFRQYAQL